MGSVEAAKARSNESALKHSHYGNKRAAQGSQRHWQQNKDEHQTRQERSRSTKPPSASSQADRKVNEMASSGKTREPDSRSSWRSDVERGQGRRMPLQDHGPKKHLSSGRTPFCKKQLDVPKSKETHTGCLIEQLTEEKYECMVCCEVIRVMAPVWSCQSCYHVFHLNCIKKWARSPASQAEGKVSNPEWNRNEIPHSCGELCCKKRSGLDCNHPCNIQSVRCGQATMIRCTDVCGSLLNCDKHTCAQVCHSGKCQPCQLQVSQECLTVASTLVCKYAIHSHVSLVLVFQKWYSAALVGRLPSPNFWSLGTLSARAAQIPFHHVEKPVPNRYHVDQMIQFIYVKTFAMKRNVVRARLLLPSNADVASKLKRLAEALNIDLSSDPFNTRGSTSKFSDSLKEDARKELKFVSEVEEVMKNLVELANKGKQSKRSHCFPPMNRDHRKIIHELAEVYGIESESYDSEPKRNIIITAVSSGNCNVMQKTVKEEPVIDYFDVQD
ncbi:UNVERIFIED_CONTAM: hypothetical protein FKN15_066220 [Acipenser sinensis]